MNTLLDERPSPPGHLLTTRDVAEHLSLSVSSVYRLLGRGELTKLRIGGATRISSEDVARLIDDSAGGTQPSSPGEVATESSR